MADDTKSSHDQQPGNPPKHTPRKPNHDGGAFKQTHLREHIARAMRNEMLVCHESNFLDKLAPFSPDDQWIENACELLTNKKLLGTPAQIARPVTPDTTAGRRSMRIASNGGPERPQPEVETESTDIVDWEAFLDAEPTDMVGTETKIFKPLEDIVNALLECPDPSGKRKANGYSYKDSPYNEMASEILGAGFKVDAVITNPNVYKTKEKKEGIAVAAAQTAVILEFKKDDDDETVLQNRKQMVSAANHIMNDDPRRNWAYGVTIENTKMSLWYFSRSYSMKSADFNFKTDYKKFIRVFLSFLYATDEELGHDPSIRRIDDNGKWCYVYALAVDKDYQYYQTIEPLYNSRSLCITGRKSRVWKAVQVVGPEDLTKVQCAREVVLKDCWVDQGSLSEKEIQTQIFNKLADVKEAEYASAPSDLRTKLKHGLACPETYFMKIELDWKEVGVNKEKPKYERAPDLLSHSPTYSLADITKAIPSSQTPLSTNYPSYGSLDPHNAPDDLSKEGLKEKRDYKVKRHYRVVYAHVGTSLAHVKGLSDAATAFQDIFIALTLLFLAGWVHRDVSEGNIILVRGKDGIRAKLSDLEYARDFSAHKAASTDPKTGTPYFMPIEIHGGRHIFPKPRPRPVRNTETGDASKVYVEFNFVHDVESLWWIIIWIIFYRLALSTSPLPGVFTVKTEPSAQRGAFFTADAANPMYLRRFIHDSLHKYDTDMFLSTYNWQLLEFYRLPSTEDETIYYNIVYGPVWRSLRDWMQLIRDSSLELKDLSEPDSAGAQALGKRSRSGASTDGGSGGRRSSVEGSSERKKQKPGQDADEVSQVQDIATIVRNEISPRIRMP